VYWVSVPRVTRVPAAAVAGASSPLARRNMNFVASLLRHASVAESAVVSVTVIWEGFGTFTHFALTLTVRPARARTLFALSWGRYSTPFLMVDGAATRYRPGATRSVTVVVILPVGFMALRVTGPLMRTWPTTGRGAVMTTLMYARTARAGAAAARSVVVLSQAVVVSRQLRSARTVNAALARRAEMRWASDQVALGRRRHIWLVSPGLDVVAGNVSTPRRCLRGIGPHIPNVSTFQRCALAVSTELVKVPARRKL
jgi:hypothetical protein